MKELLELFLTFAKIGVMTFGGGMAMLPILEREVVQNKHWATEEELVDYFAIGQRIKQVRRDRGMTQERLAEALSVSVGYISQIERGVTKISLETLAAVAACLACDLSELATGVAVTQEHYLDRELAQLTARMDGRQKKLLHELARLILKY